MNSIENYIAEVVSHPLLSAKEEREIAKIIKTAKNKKDKAVARERLINSNLRLVIKLAYSFHRFCKTPIGDLIGAGNTGLVKAVDQFNPEKYATKFSTFAFPLIRQRISQEAFGNDREVYIPRHILNKMKQYNNLSHTEEISDKEIMEKLDVSENILTKIKMAKSGSISLDQNISVEEGGKVVTYKEIIEDPSAIKANDQAFYDEKEEALKDAISKLNPVEQDIIRSIFFCDKKQREIANKYGVSSEAIRQKKEKALKKLRWHMRKYK